MSFKHRISSPLEAGPSILDAHQLPSHLHSALEYTSKRLARKDLHITLLVVRREYQVQEDCAPSASAAANPNTNPIVFSPPASPGSLPSSTASTPSRPGFASHMATLKQLARSRTHPTLPSLAGGAAAPETRELQRSKTMSPTYSLSSADASSPRLKWPLSPMSPYSSIPTTPATPALTVSTATTASSTTGTDASSSCGPNPFGLRLVHASSLDFRVEKILRQTIEKAERRFRIGNDWLPPAVSPDACGLTPDLIQRSLAQNEVLFSSSGLTLLSLDHLYTFKSALASYVATGSAYRLEDAVDELRRYVLSNGRRRLRRSVLLRAYGWLSPSGGDDAALADVARMYRRAYGGLERDSGIEDDVDPLSSNPPLVIGVKAREGERPLPPLPAEATVANRDLPIFGEIKIGEDILSELVEEERPKEEEPGDPVQEEPDANTPTTSPSQPSPPASPLKGPVLKLQTTFDTPLLLKPQARRPPLETAAPPVPSGIPIHLDAEEGGDSDGDLTARPDSQTLGRGGFWNSASIDQVLSGGGGRDAPSAGGEEDGQLGPITPHGYDDISPITRGEWGFLMVGDAWKARTVAVETC